jgi:predicted enzyme related to lactoylglutathione lyase
VHSLEASVLKSCRISTLFFLVRDIEQTLTFYRDAVGLDIDRLPMEDGGDWLIAHTAGGVDLIFCPGDPRPGNTPVPVFELGEGGIDDVVDGLVNAGASLVTPVSHAPGGWTADVADPDGNTLSLYQDVAAPRRR